MQTVLAGCPHLYGPHKEPARQPAVTHWQATSCFSLLSVVPSQLTSALCLLSPEKPPLLFRTCWEVGQDSPGPREENTETSASRKAHLTLVQIHWTAELPASSVPGSSLRLTLFLHWFLPVNGKPCKGRQHSVTLLTQKAKKAFLCESTWNNPEEMSNLAYISCRRSNSRMTTIS